jgi:uncharacterized membrane protein YphA (DoxX/SURF4 family)
VLFRQKKFSLSFFWGAGWGKIHKCFEHTTLEIISLGLNHGNLVVVTTIRLQLGLILIGLVQNFTKFSTFPFGIILRTNKTKNLCKEGGMVTYKLDKI